MLEMYQLGYVTFTFRNINIDSISLLEGSSLIYQPTCIKHGNAEVPRILGFAIECFTDWLKTLLTRLYRAWGSFGVLPLWRRIHTKVTVIFPLLSVTFPRWLFPFLRKQRSFSVEGIKLQFLLYKTKMLLFQMAIDEIVIHHIFELSSSLHFSTLGKYRWHISRLHRFAILVCLQKGGWSQSHAYWLDWPIKTIIFSSACQLCLRQLI